MGGKRTGKRRRVMVACVTFEVAKVVDPIAYYEVSKAHLIHYDGGIAEGERNYYREFLDEVVARATEENPSLELVFHCDGPVTDFTSMMRLVLRILHAECDEDPETEIFVNVTVGPSGYAAAATIASMMVDAAIPFTVGTEDYKIRGDDIVSTYYEDGVPVGLAKTTKPPFALEKYRIEMPDPVLVSSLALFKARMDAKVSTANSSMIYELKQRGLWLRDGPPDEEASKAKNANSVYYQRNYVDRWIANGWIAKDPRTRKYAVTQDGETVLETFSHGRIFFEAGAM